ncbi:type IVB secretion system protein IcmH/DotU [Pseudaeromonas sharmana]|uniref:Type IVB secretion system protein IcmH/DotU n=1 Tax=Pseudaeromonas sharmana TaxID=328412 RepID=A0ABV8CP13_9GAMM
MSGTSHPTSPLQSALLDNRLLWHAHSFLRLLCQQQHLTVPEDLFSFQQTLIQQLQQLGARLIADGYSESDCDGWRYMLCCALDEAIMSRSWELPSPWPQMTLMLYFYQEGKAGSRLYERLDGWLRQPAPPRELLQGIHLCLSLGYEGRYRIEAGGAKIHRQWREQLFHFLYGHPQPKVLSFPALIHLMPQPQPGTSFAPRRGLYWLWLLLFTIALYLFYQSQLNDLAHQWIR